MKPTAEELRLIRAAKLDRKRKWHYLGDPQSKLRLAVTFQDGQPVVANRCPDYAALLQCN